MNKIQITEQQMQALSRGESITIQPPKPDKWEPKGGAWNVTCYGTVSVGESLTEFREFGIERKTNAEAEHAARLMRQHNRLLAYVAEHRREGEEDIYCVCQNSDGGLYRYDTPTRSLGEVRMPERVAEQLIADIETGRYEP